LVPATRGKRVAIVREHRRGGGNQTGRWGKKQRCPTARKNLEASVEEGQRNRGVAVEGEKIGGPCFGWGGKKNFQIHFFWGESGCRSGCRRREGGGGGNLEVLRKKKTALRE